MTKFEVFDKLLYQTDIVTAGWNIMFRAFLHSVGGVTEKEKEKEFSTVAQWSEKATCREAALILWEASLTVPSRSNQDVVLWRAMQYVYCKENLEEFKSKPSSVRALLGTEIAF